MEMLTKLQEFLISRKACGWDEPDNPEKAVGSVAGKTIQEAWDTAPGDYLEWIIAHAHPDVVKARADRARARAEFDRARDEYDLAIDRALAEFNRADAEYDLALDRTLDEFARALDEYDRAEYARALAEYDRAEYARALARALADARADARARTEYGDAIRKAYPTPPPHVMEAYNQFLEGAGR